MHSRGDAVRAAVILAQGLKREPTDVEAVGWLLHLYVEELPNPGIEADLLQVLALQPNGADLLAIVRAELDELALDEKSRALEKTLEHTPLAFHSAPPAEPPSPTTEAPAERPPSPSSELHEPAPSANRENWDSFDSPFDQLSSDSGPATAPTSPTGPTQPSGSVSPAEASDAGASPKLTKESPELADRALSASIDLALSQPLAAHDPPPSSAAAAPVAGAGRGIGFWAVIAGVAIVCGILIIGYVRSGVADDAPNEVGEWAATAPDADDGAEGSGEERAPVADEPPADEASAVPSGEEPVEGSGDGAIEAPTDGEAP